MVKYTEQLLYVIKSFVCHREWGVSLLNASLSVYAPTSTVRNIAS